MNIFGKGLIEAKGPEEIVTRVAAIEAVLCRLPEVREAAVVVREHDSAGRQAVAYIVSEGPFNSQRLHADLASLLSESAMPIAIVPVSSLPVTAAGCVDEQVLARLEVIDPDVVRGWEDQLRSLPEIDQVAVVLQENSDPIPPLHLSDLLPDWKSAPDREVDESQTATVQARTAPEVGGSGTLAISHGGPLRQDAGAPVTLPAVIERAARESPTRGVVYIQSDETEIFQSYPALLEEAERILAGLRNVGLKPQDKVLFQLERNQDFIAAFWGCQLGGFVPVPISIAPTYSSMNSAVSKLNNAWQMLDRPIILTDRALAPAVQSLSERSSFGNLRVATIDECRRYERDRNWHKSHPDDLAILLLTSGSTGLPKAVMQSQRSLVSRSAGTSQLNSFSRHDISLNWMPLDHVGGIVMFHVRDVYLGCQQIHVPTELILQDPLKWLDLIERFRATLTWAPNFAFGLVNAKEEAILKRRWNLSSMRFILNGGEAIVARTARRFLRLLRPHGLPETCMHPAWGMSETSSGVTYSDRFSVDATSDDDSFVEVGAPIPGFSMRIVDNQDRVAPEEAIGRLQVKGASVTSGYYQNSGLTKQAFSADGWFETGDLGYLRRGRLTIAGREKDVIIVNGVNYHSHEIEAVVEEIPGVVVSYTAACSVRGSATDTDKLAVFFHPACNEDIVVAGLLKEIRENVVRRIGINPDYLIPVDESAIPKTAIGKIQRTLLSDRLKAGEFDPVLKRVDILTSSANTLPAWFYRKIWRRKRPWIPRNQSQIRPTLVFLDRSGLGALLCAELNRRNWPEIHVEAGSDFGKVASNHYRIDPKDPEHYRQLLAMMAADGIQIEQVLHLWTYDLTATAIVTADQLERSQDHGVFSLLFLVQALAQRHENSRRVHMLVVSSNSQCVLRDDQIAFEKGALPGFIKSVPQEMPWLSCNHLDLPVDDARANVACILAEIQSGSRDGEVAYRHGERWIPRLSRVDFQQQTTHELPFRRGGMYLLSGGLGGIGVEIAKYLLQQYEAKLLLVGRTPLALNSSLDDGGMQTSSSESIKAYRELEQLAGEIAYAAVDVCDRAGLQQVVERAQSRWRCELDGVIHLAGIYQEKLLTEETRGTFAGVLRPKVFGTWVLSQLLEDRPDKVFISFSSLNSFFGGALVGAYSAANCFLNGFARYQRRRHSIKSYCFEWSTWDDLGMSRGNPMRELMRSRGYCAISKKQGLLSFLAALRHDQSHLLIGLDGSNEHVRKYADADSYRLQKLCAFFTPRVGVTAESRLRELSLHDRFGTRVGCEFRQVPELPQTEAGEIDRDKLTGLRRRADQAAMESVAPRTDLERRVAAFWREVLAIPQVGIHDNFFDLGGNSLLATQVASRIQDAYQVRLPLRTLLEESTVAKLALALQRHLEEVPATGTDAFEKIATMGAKRTLEELDQLSDEDVSALLKRMLVRDMKQ